MRNITLWLTVLILAVSFSSVVGKERNKMSELKIMSPAFVTNGYIPARYTCDGTDINPPLEISHVPGEAKSLALIVDDPDAPVGMKHLLRVRFQLLTCPIRACTRLKIFFISKNRYLSRVET